MNEQKFDDPACDDCEECGTGINPSNVPPCIMCAWQSKDREPIDEDARAFLAALAAKAKRKTPP